MPRPVSLSPADRRFVATVEAAAEAHLGDARFGVEALADAVGLSARQLTRRLGAATGETPGVLVRRLRLARAAEMLRAGFPVGQTTAAVGLGSRSQFSRLFREAYGAAPSAFAAESSRPAGRMSEMGTEMSGSGTHG